VIVCKFGGTSVADAAAITRAGEIVRDRRARRPVVVVSALAGVTNALLGAAAQAAEGQLLPALHAVTALRERHLAEVEALLGGTAAAIEVGAEIGAQLDELAHLCEALATLGHLTPRSLDAIAAMGEQMASVLVVAAFRRMGLDAAHVRAQDVIKTDDAFTRAEPDGTAIASAARAGLAPLLAADRVPVLGGFVGATAQGVTTTLGRGGSDYTASLVGAALDAEAIEIWTDVDGMLTADPRVIPEARLIPQIRFDEASELAYFGAKVLHPSTIDPAVRKGIPVYVFNSRRPEGAGTRITFDAPRRAVTAIAGKTGVTVIKVRSTRMLLAHGFLHAIFGVFARHRTSVDVVTTSEVSVSVTVDDASHLDDLVSDLRTFGDVSVEQGRGIVALVGSGLGDGTREMARALAALDDMRVHMLSLSATGINLTLIVDGGRVQDVMRRLHGALFPEA
jgi:aspartate kinase